MSACRGEAVAIRTPAVLAFFWRFYLSKGATIDEGHEIFTRGKTTRRPARRTLSLILRQKSRSKKNGFSVNAKRFSQTRRLGRALSTVYNQSNYKRRTIFTFHDHTRTRDQRDRHPAGIHRRPRATSLTDTIQSDQVINWRFLRWAYRQRSNYNLRTKMHVNSIAGSSSFHSGGSAEHASSRHMVLRRIPEYCTTLHDRDSSILASPSAPTLIPTAQPTVRWRIAGTGLNSTELEFELELQQIFKHKLRFHVLTCILSLFRRSGGRGKVFHQLIIPNFPIFSFLLFKEDGEYNSYLVDDPRTQAFFSCQLLFKAPSSWGFEHACTQAHVPLKEYLCLGVVWWPYGDIISSWCEKRPMVRGWPGRLYARER